MMLPYRSVLISLALILIPFTLRRLVARRKEQKSKLKENQQ